MSWLAAWAINSRRAAVRGGDGPCAEFRKIDDWKFSPTGVGMVRCLRVATAREAPGRVSRSTNLSDPSGRRTCASGGGPCGGGSARTSSHGPGSPVRVRVARVARRNSDRTHRGSVRIQMRERVEDTRRSSPGTRLSRAASIKSWNRASRPGRARSRSGISSGSTFSIG
jgi:hypothetical protein